MKHLCLLCLFVLPWSLSGGDKRPASVYFLAVGSEHFVPAPKANRPALRRINGANHSAKEVASVLTTRGAVYGALLTSKRNAVLDRDDVFAALDALITQAGRDKAPAKLLVFYFCGATMGEGGQHLALPGSFTKAPLETRHLKQLAAQTISTAAVYKRLAQSKLPFLMMLDNGYNEEGRRTIWNLPAGARLGAAMTASEGRDKPFTGPHPVLFAARQGTEVPMVKTPDQDKAMGSLARRLILVFQNSKALDLAGLVTAMKDPKLDTLTKPAVCRASNLSTRLVLPRMPVRHRIKVVESHGSVVVRTGKNGTGKGDEGDVAGHRE